MIKEPKLLTIQRVQRRPSKAQIGAFQGVLSGFVEDAMGGGASMDSNVKPVVDGPLYDQSIAGPALTADNGPADILATLGALEFIKPGDVVVSSCGGFQGAAAGGDRVAGMMQNKGAVGFVTDGPMRDSGGIIEVGLPCWCTGLTPASPFSKGPGRVGTKIDIAGRSVQTGDMIVADRDGVVVVPFEQIDEVIEALKEIVQLEAARDQEVADGLTSPQAIKDLLASDQVDYID